MPTNTRTPFRVRTRALLATVAIAFMSVALPVRACCDDFWSCCAAVATGGLSCAVENLINSVKSMIQNVENLVRTIGQQAADIVNLAKSELGGAANDLRNLAAQAEGDFNGAVNLGQSIVDAEGRPQILAPALAGGSRAGAGASATGAAGMAGAPSAATATGSSKRTTGGAAGLPPGPGISPAMTTVQQAIALPGDPKDILDALKRANAALASFRPEVVNPLNTVRQFANQAEQQALAAAASAGNIAESVLLAPLRTLSSMLTDLVTHPQNIFDPSKLVDDAITSITNQVIDTMNRVHDAVMSQAKATLDQAHRPIQEVLDRAASAKKIADAMEKLHKQRTRGSLEALNNLVPRNQVPINQLVAHVAGFTHASGLTAIDLGAHNAKALAPFNRLTASKLTAKTIGSQLGSRLRKPWQDFKRMQAAPPVPVPEAKPKVDAELERRFAGKTPQQADAEKRALISEARTRFANDPKTLDKVMIIIEGHPAIRSRVSPGGDHLQGAGLMPLDRTNNGNTTREQQP